jgi:hypothetical protein
LISLASTVCLPRFPEMSGLFRIRSGNKPATVRSLSPRLALGRAISGKRICRVLRVLAEDVGKQLDRAKDTILRALPH